MVSHPHKTAVFPEGSCTEQPQAAAVTNCPHSGAAFSGGPPQASYTAKAKLK